MGKALFMTFQGDDARQGDYCRTHFEVTFASRVPADYYAPASDAAKRRRITRIGRYADGIYALNPDLLHVLPVQARFLPYANVDPRVWQPSVPPDNALPVVVHAPTHRLVKGTDLIVQAVDRLRAEGERFEFVLIEGMSHEEARRAYARADFAIDQLFAGWYGGFAVELMALGKPVISYLREGDLGYLPAEMRGELPVINANPATLYEVLRDWLRAPPARLRERGIRSRAYVERWHDPLKIAARLKHDYEAALAGRRVARERGSELGGRH
jgi:glycosyltransferase involved in cell wall biosynthesis